MKVNPNKLLMELAEMKALLDVKTNQFAELEKQGKSRDDLAPLYKELKDLQYQLLQLELKTIDEQQGPGNGDLNF